MHCGKCHILNNCGGDTSEHLKVAGSKNKEELFLATSRSPTSNTHHCSLQTSAKAPQVTRQICRIFCYSKLFVVGPHLGMVHSSVRTYALVWLKAEISALVWLVAGNFPALLLFPFGSISWQKHHSAVHHYKFTSTFQLHLCGIQRCLGASQVTS